MKSNSVQLDQAFFGNDQNGYCLLGCTDNRFSHDVAFYCNAIGTPDGFSAFKPFLFSVPKDDFLLMFCCQAGAADASGRRTLFFHAIIADRKVVNEFNVNAYTLYDSGYFSDSLIDGCLPIELSKPLTQSNCHPVPFAWNGEPLAIISEKPETTLIRALLGDSVNSLPWANFTYQPLENFRLYVISKYVNRPQGRKCVLPSGEVLPKGLRDQSSFKGPQSPKPPQVTTMCHCRVFKILFISSVFLNLALAYLYLMDSRTGERSQNKVPEAKIVIQREVEYLDREVIKEVPVEIKPSMPPLTREQVLTELRTHFPVDKEIENFDEIVKGSSRLKALNENPREEYQEVGLISKISAYISFVNTYILTINHDEGGLK